MIVAEGYFPGQASGHLSGAWGGELVSAPQRAQRPRGPAWPPTSPPCAPSLPSPGPSAVELVLMASHHPTCRGNPKGNSSSPRRCIYRPPAGLLPPHPGAPGWAPPGRGLAKAFLIKCLFFLLCFACFLSNLPPARFLPQRICMTFSSLHSPTRLLYLSRTGKPRCGSPGAKLDVGCVHPPIISLSSLLGTHLGPLHSQLAAWESLGYRELVRGADLCCSQWPVLLHLGAPSCLVWLVQVRGWGQGQWATGTAPAGPHQAQTRWSGPAQSPAVCLNGLLVLSRKLSPARPPHQAEGGGGEGRERAWPRALAGLAGSPCSGLAFYL